MLLRLEKHIGYSHSLQYTTECVCSKEEWRKLSVLDIYDLPPQEEMGDTIKHPKGKMESIGAEIRTVSHKAMHYGSRAKERGWISIRSESELWYLKKKKDNHITLRLSQVVAVHNAVYSNCVCLLCIDTVCTVHNKIHRTGSTKLVSGYLLRHTNQNEM